MLLAQVKGGILRPYPLAVPMRRIDQTRRNIAGGLGTFLAAEDEDMAAQKAIASLMEPSLGTSQAFGHLGKRKGVDRAVAPRDGGRFNVQLHFGGEIAAGIDEEHVSSRKWLGQGVERFAPGEARRLVARGFWESRAVAPMRALC
jgi:hypothetical protein